MQLKGNLTQLPPNIRSPSVANAHAPFKRKIIGVGRRTVAIERGWTRMNTDENPSHGEFLGRNLIPRIK